MADWGQWEIVDDDIWIRDENKCAKYEQDFLTWAQTEAKVDFDFLEWSVSIPTRSIEDDDHVCGICNNSAQNGQWIVKTSCKHVFHLDHLQAWSKICKKNKLPCPECNMDLMRKQH